MSACTARSKPRPRAHRLHTCRGQQRKFDRFRQEFNFERPHEALDMQTPAVLLRLIAAPDARTSSRRWSTRRTSRCATSAHNGGIRWNCGWVNVIDHLRRRVRRLRGDRRRHLECLLRTTQARSAARTTYANRRCSWEDWRTGKKCNLCPRTILLPMSPTAHHMGNHTFICGRQNSLGTLIINLVISYILHISLKPIMPAMIFSLRTASWVSSN